MVWVFQFFDYVKPSATLGALVSDSGPLVDAFKAESVRAVVERRAIVCLNLEGGFVVQAYRAGPRLLLRVLAQPPSLGWRSDLMIPRLLGVPQGHRGRPYGTLELSENL